MAAVVQRWSSLHALAPGERRSGRFDRPSWIENVRFALRINVPLKKYDERKRHD